MWIWLLNRKSREEVEPRGKEHRIPSTQALVKWVFSLSFYVYYWIILVYDYMNDDKMILSNYHEIVIVVIEKKCYKLLRKWRLVIMSRVDIEKMKTCYNVTGWHRGNSYR